MPERGVLQGVVCSKCWRRSPSGFFPLRWPSFHEEEHDDADPGMALLASLQRPGGQAQSFRHLKKLTDSGLDPLKYIDTDQLGQVIRIGKRYEDFVHMVRPDFGREGWSTGIDEKSRLWFGHRVDRSAQALHVVLVQDIQGIDPVRALVGYCFTDLFTQHSTDVQACTVLEEAVDCGLWNQVRCYSDDIVQVDLVNALDEPLGAIMLMIHAAPEGSPDFPQACIPGPCRPCRAHASKQCMTFTPAPGGSVRVHVAVITPLGNEKIMLEIERLPKEGMAKIIRPLIAEWPMNFEKFLRENTVALIQKEAFCAQAPFYAVCRGYLSGQAGPKHSSLRQWGAVVKDIPGKWPQNGA